MHFRIQRVLQETIVSAFDNRQAEIARMSKRIEPRSLLDRLGFQREETLGVTI